MNEKSTAAQIYQNHYDDFLHNPDNLFEPLKELYPNLNIYRREKEEQITRINEFIDSIKKGCFHEIGVYPSDRISIKVLKEMKPRLMGVEGGDLIVLCDLVEATGRTVTYDSEENAIHLNPHERTFHCGAILIDPSQAISHYREGLAKLNQGAVEEGLFLLDLSAKEGDIEASLLLGSKYMMGAGVGENTLRAVFYYFLSAINGSPEACFNLGLLYSRGIGVLQDKALALTYLNLAKEKGVEEADEEIRLAEKDAFASKRK